MSKSAAHFLAFLLFFMAFAPVTAFAVEKMAQSSVTTMTETARAGEKAIYLSDIAEWGLLLADVLLAAVGIFIAVAGVVGYYFIKAAVEKSAQDTARKEFKDFLEGSDIKKIIVETVKKEADAPLTERAENEKTNEKGEEK